MFPFTKIAGTCVYDLVLKSITSNITNIIFGEEGWSYMDSLFLWGVEVLGSGVQCSWHHLPFWLLLLSIQIWSIRLFQLISRTPLFRTSLMLRPSSAMGMTCPFQMVLLNNYKELGVQLRYQSELKPFFKLLLTKNHVHGFWQHHPRSLVHAYGCMPFDYHLLA